MDRGTCRDLTESPAEKTACCTLESSLFMPLREVNGTKLYCEISGSGPEVLFFSHGLLFNHRMWSSTVDHFNDRFTCVVYDHRGQGQSDRGGGRDMDLLAEDAAALIRSLNRGPVHYVGLSMGGFVGLRVAARHPDLLRSLSLMNTSAHPERHMLKYTVLLVLMRLFGIRSVSSRILPVMFGHTALKDANRQSIIRETHQYLNTLTPDVRYAVEGVLNRPSVIGELSRIRCPVLLIAGMEDKATGPGRTRYIASQIPQAQTHYLERTGHMSVLEDPTVVNRLLANFYSTLESGC